MDLYNRFTDECRFVIKAFKVIYHNDKVTREEGMSDEQRLSYHQTHSKPTMDHLKAWLGRQFDEKFVEPNSALGEAINYLLKRWDSLTLFLREAGAPLPAWISESELLSGGLETLGSLLPADPSNAGELLATAGTRISGRLVSVASGIARNAFTFGFTFVVLYGFYVGGEEILALGRRLAPLLFPTAPEGFFENVGGAVRAVVFGLIGTAIVQGTDQGRLIYPILPTVMLVLAAGWAWWGRGRAQSWLLGGLSAGMLILAVVTPIRYIAPVHAPAPVASTDELAAAEPLSVDWNGIRLLGYRLESDTVRAGDKLVLHLYWQGLVPIDRDFMALIKLVDSEGEFLMYTDGSPTAGRDTTDRWMPGVPLASRHLLPVPDYGTPGSYRLTISLHPFGEQTWLPALGQDGSALGDQVSLPVTVHVTAP